MKRSLTRDQEQEVVQRYLEGSPLKAIAAEYGVSTSPIVGALERAGIERRKKGWKGNLSAPWLRVFSKDEEHDLALLYKGGAFVPEMARERGVSRKAVMNALKRQGVKMRSRRETAQMLNARRRERGEPHPNLRMGRTKTNDGYYRTWIADTDPLRVMAGVKPWVLEHRLVMARVLNRPLGKNETVHHKNGDRGDNRIENLQLRKGRHGKGIALECADCGSHNIVEAEL
jgi:predicted DNA-binding protein YlxM (UPF0122 family)